MIPVDDPFITDEARQIILDIRGTTGKLMRAFAKRENQLLLEKSFNVKSQDFTKFNETIANLEKLYESYMTTPLEEVNSVKNQLKQLEGKVTQLNETRDSKKDQLDKHIEECNKSKEVRNVQVTLLAEQRRSEQSEKDNQIADSVEKGKRDEEEIRLQHEKKVEELKKTIDTIQKKLTQTMKDNGQQEAELSK